MSRITKTQRQLLADLANGGEIVVERRFGKLPKYRLITGANPRGILYVTLDALDTLGYLEWDCIGRTFAISDTGRAAIAEAQNTTE